jgi:negative regulator of sigma E activity
MNQRPTLREQIDACRADSDDLHLPEHAADLAELKTGVQQSAEIRGLWERSQRDDRSIRGAMHDITLPAGLEQRLLAAVQAADEPPLASVEKVVDEEVPAQGAAPASRPAPIMARRRWLSRTVTALAATAALVLVAVLGNRFFNPPDVAITKDELVSQTQEWLQATSKVKWDANTTQDKFPVRNLKGKANRSGSVASSQGTITVYDVKLPTSSSRATLFVLPTTAKYPVYPLPFTDVPVSGGWKVGAWQTGGVLYVLVVSDKDGLEEFIRHQPIG